MPFAQLPITPVPSAATCLAATGAPGEISRWTPSGVELMSVSAAGLRATGEVPLGKLASCPAVAGRPNGSAIIAAASGKRLRIVLRAPGGGWSAPVTIRSGRSIQDPAAAVSSNGDAVVAWAEYDRRRRGRLRVVSRPRNGAFGAPSTVSGWGAPMIPTYAAVGIADDGSALLGFSPGSGRERTLVASARPGGRFGRPVSLGVSSTPFAPALAVAPNGRALVMLADGVVERPPGGAFARPAQIPGAIFLETPSIALHDDGAAAVAWSQGDGDLEVVARPTAGPFGGLLAAGATPFNSGFSSVYVSLPGTRASGPPRPQPAGPGVVLSADGRALVAGPAKAGVRLATATASALSDVETIPSPLREVTSALPIVTTDGARAVVWEDDLPDAPYRGRLHVAVEGAVPAPPGPAPTVQVLRPRIRSLRWNAPLELRVRCSAACDLRAKAASGVDARASLGAAGTAKLRLTPIDEPIAPAKPGPVEIEVLSGAPGAERAQRTTLELTLRRIPAPPLPRMLDATAVRHGSRIDVRWRTDRPAVKGVAFLAFAQRSRHGETLGYDSVRGRGQTRFHLVLRNSARAREVLIDEQRPLAGDRTTTVKVG